MVPKYTRPEMGRIWSDQHGYELWLRVEIAATEAWHELGEVPTWAVEKIRHAGFDVARIAEYEEKTQHDVIAFTHAINETIGEANRYLHLGLTSNDVKDTALMLQLLESMDEIVKGVEQLRETVGRLAVEHRHTLMMGRTHGIHAEPITFGFKMAVWYDDLRRILERFEMLRKELSIAKIGGAVGSHSNVPREVEEIAACRLGLRPANAETQVIQRDRIARYVLDLAVLGSTLDKFATEIRTLQRTEFREVQEPFSETQAGSSAMPHKRNPVLCERVTGLGRLMRGYASSVLENIVLWNERDISNSSLERVMLPDISIACDYALSVMDRVLSGLKVFPDRMMANIEATQGLVFSQRVLRALLDSGLDREAAYRTVQRNSLKAYDSNLSLQSMLEQDPEVSEHLSADTIKSLFDYSWFTNGIEITFERTGLAGVGQHASEG
jgi:adenylosuccinate lyase